MDKPTQSRLPLKRKIPVFNNGPSTSNNPPVTRPNKNLMRRSKSFSDLRAVKEKPTVEATSTVTLGKRPAPPIKAPLLKPKIAKTTSAKPEKENSKPPARIPPYDYKARYHALNERFDKFKALHINCKEIAGLHEELQLKYDDTKEKLELLQPKYELVFAELKAYKNDVKELKVVVTNVKTELYECSQLRKRLQEDYEQQQVEIERIKKINSQYEEQIKQLDDMVLKQKKKIEESDHERRRLHNLVQELKGNIRVFCRVRPALSSEEQRSILDISYNSDKIEIRTPRGSNAVAKTSAVVQEFMYDAVFPPATTQLEIFEELDMLVQSALDGYHVCVFAYGQTGSGKTFTMQGNRTENESGMIPRSVHSLFKRITDLELAGWNYNVQVSFLEVYNETIKDLLNPVSKLNYDIKYNEGKGVTVTNLQIKTVYSDEELQKLISVAEQNRSVAVTNYNEHSSRSHAVTKIYLQGTDSTNTTILNGSINLVDLAGSENAKLSTNETITETKHINKSLAALGNVMLALHNGDSHIPYRDSKLTYLLGSSLGGNSKTLMFLNIAPFQDCFSETISALRFAQKVKNVKVNFKKNKCVL